MLLFMIILIKIFTRLEAGKNYYFVDNKEDVVLEKENIKLKENMLLKIKDGKVEEVVYDSDIQTRLK